MNENLNNIMQKLSDYTQNYPASQIIGELEVATERIGFANLDTVEERPLDELKEKLEFILNRDISPGIIRFIHYLVDNKLLGVLMNDAGKIFVNHCSAYFAQLKQLTFRTAVSLRAEKQREIRTSLLSIYPINSRIIFEVDKDLVAGFTLTDSGSTVVDQSHKTRVVKLIEQYIRKQIPVA